MVDLKLLRRSVALVALPASDDFATAGLAQVEREDRSMPRTNQPLELRRLLTRDRAALPALVFVDVSAVARHQREHHPNDDPWPRLVNVAARVTDFRRVLFVVAPPITPFNLIDLHDLHTRLTGLGADVVRSDEPLGVLLEMASDITVGMVIAGVERRVWEFAVMRRSPCVVLDVATGRLWTRGDVEREFGLLEGLELWSAAAMARYGERPIVPEAAKPIYAQAVLRHRGWLIDLDSKASRRVVDAIVERYSELTHEARLRGGEHSPADGRARQSVHHVTRPDCRSDTAYLTVLSSSNRSAVYLTVDGFTGDGGDDIDTLIAIRAELDRKPRWVMPRALDTLGWMLECGLPLPQSVIDPGLCLFVRNPDDPPSLRWAHPEASGLATTTERWLEDTKRRVPAPADGDGRALHHQLPRLDGALTVDLKNEGLVDLVEIDLGPTLPVLARIEHVGLEVGAAPVPFVDWNAVREHLRQLYAPQLAGASKLLRGLDPVRANLRDILHAAMPTWGFLPATHYASGQSPKDTFGRYVALGAPGAQEIEDARSFFGGTSRWVQRLETGVRLRGMQRLGTTGRWSFAEVALHQLPKRPPYADVVLGALVAPTGQIFLAADYKAFEPRLLASLSGDPVLLRNAWLPSQRDLYRGLMAEPSIALLLSNIAPHHRRELVKSVLLALMYDQSRRQFAHGLHALALSDGERLYDAFTTLLAQACSYRDHHAVTLLAGNGVRSPRGWRRLPMSKGRKRLRQGFNAIIQGAAADVLRFVLRELHEALRAYDARVVHQGHDAVVVACPMSAANAVECILRDVMEIRARYCAGVLSLDVPLYVEVKTGATWLDIV